MQTKEERKSGKHRFSTFLEKERSKDQRQVERSKTGEFNMGEGMMSNVT